MNEKNEKSWATLEEQRLHWSLKHFEWSLRVQNLYVKANLQVPVQ